MKVSARALFGVAVCGVALATSAHAGLTEHFRNQFGALELYDSNAKLSFRVNPPRLTEALPACGMANLGIAVAALKAGVIKPADTRISWDQDKHAPLSVWPGSWQRPQVLDRAFRFNVQWYFDEMAERIGSTKLEAELIKLGYRSPGPGINPLQWKVSTLELVELIRRIDVGQVGLNAEANAALKDALLRERKDGKQMYALGARCTINETTPFAWRAGMVIGNPKPVYYGLHLQGKTIDTLRGESDRIIRDAMTEMEYY